MIKLIIIKKKEYDEEGQFNKDNNITLFKEKIRPEVEKDLYNLNQKKEFKKILKRVFFI